MNVNRSPSTRPTSLRLLGRSGNQTIDRGDLVDEPIAGVLPG